MFDRILIRRDEPPQMMHGLHVPEGSHHGCVCQTIRGVIVALGQGRRNDSGGFLAIPLEIGTFVTIARYTGHEIIVDGETLIVVREDDVLAKMTS